MSSSSSDSGASSIANQRQRNELFKENTQYTNQMNDMISLVSTIDVKADDAFDNEYSANRLFISNFPFSWTEKDLRDFLKDFEPVAEVEIVYNERGSKGFGFVTINDAKKCMDARAFLNHKIVNGRRVEVRRAHKHKRAMNSGSTKQNYQQQLQNLNSMLQQTALLQATLMQPGLLNLLQQQLMVPNPVAKHPGVSASAIDLASLIQKAPTTLRNPYSLRNQNYQYTMQNAERVEQMYPSMNVGASSSASVESSSGSSASSPLSFDPSGDTQLNSFSGGIDAFKAPTYEANLYVNQGLFDAGTYNALSQYNRSVSLLGHFYFLLCSAI
ncbi:unnamed protein product, partial [Mesorhabditis belari]|uniref:RRM domain-containing protein n=1 Tax=Mesorhabditis belari TaxID=2138241 RepID=A0AAF3EYN2_9BILA